ncbi:radical SAM/SPASM domain-containing protein [Cuniculiplasma divulgatum]|uniref:Radical SAM superfamily enzyme n=1 Tax=Cuniculiplasma divulgatum TaxID=1673428 RepID=A0A1N5UF85_9ARCH|nr:radical SAM protein [Cuniculiplasma divulgatum]SIM58905.1 radical SAM superfamily enzyme [Cuniculiplasma divulgatum]
MLPTVATWTFTNKCNLKCIYCANRGNHINSVEELSTHQKFKVAERLSSYNIKEIGLTGGEFFLAKDWQDILKKLGDLDFDISINSNGTLFSDRIIKVVEKYADKISNISVSLDGYNEEFHDRTRGKGTFAKTIYNLRSLKNENINFDINWNLTSDNYKHLTKMIDLCKDIGAKGLTISTLEPIGAGKLLDRNLFITSSQLETFTQMFYNIYRSHEKNFNLSLNYPFSFLVDPNVLVPLIREQRKTWENRHNCGIFSNRIFIDPAGNILPCNFIQEPTDNLLNTDLECIWGSKTAIEWRKIVQNRNKCEGCTYSDICVGCPAVALARTGDVGARDPLCSSTRI